MATKSNNITNEIPLEPGQTYHIFNHANGFENLFKNDGNYIYFLNKYNKHISPIADTLAYCLMPNHLHLLVRIKPVSELPFFGENSPGNHLNPENQEFSNCSLKISKAFGSLFSAYAQAFNKQQKRRGSLFVPNFKRKWVHDDWYFGTLIRYIHQNPVEAGFVRHIAEWPHSSFNSILSDKPTRLCRDQIIAFYGGKPGFIEAHGLHVEDKFLRLLEKW